mgnify:CR=1 FL=1
MVGVDFGGVDAMTDRARAAAGQGAARRRAGSHPRRRRSGRGRHGQIAVVHHVSGHAVAVVVAPTRPTPMLVAADSKSGRVGIRLRRREANATREERAAWVRLPLNRYAFVR